MLYLRKTSVHYLRLVFVFFLFGNLICGYSQTENKKIIHNTIERNYFIHVPKTYNSKKNVPLVLAYHGRGDSAYMFMYYTKFNDIADKHNFIVVYPQGTEHKGATGWQNNNGVDDIAFTQVLIDKIVTEYKVDASRVYVTGMSNG